MRVASHFAILVISGFLTGCVSDGPFLKKPADATVEVASRSGNFQQDGVKQKSGIIDELLSRQSLLPKDSPYGRVALGALNASARASEAELRSARLRAEAQSKNWLPTIGPNISLYSLGDMVAGILVEQVLFDNGRRKAERAFAAADVEVAAVNLSIDMNDRVHTALSLYMTAQRADEKTRLSARALARMHEFERIVIGRVQGGVSDRSDQRVVEAKLNDMRAAKAASEEAAAAARAELHAMTGQNFDAPGTDLQIATLPEHIEALNVLKARAEAARSIAQATAERAGLLPGLTATGNVSGSGTEGGLNVASSQGFGFGTGAQLRALEASKETASRQIDEANETARRNLSRLKQRLASYRRQVAEAADLARSSRETFRLFERQFQAGQRSVMDVIGIYERLVQREQAYIDAKYEVVLIQLDMARERGLLADGDLI